MFLFLVFLVLAFQIVTCGKGKIKQGNQKKGRGWHMEKKD